MKLLNLLMICFIFIACSNTKKLASSNQKKQQSVSNSSLNLQALSETWKLVFSDEFNTVGNFDNSKWTYSPRFNPAWAKYLTSTPDYASLNGSSLVLKMDNSVIEGDNVPYHSGGIQTSTKFSFRYGKVEVRAKFKQGQGSWPAIWMMPEIPVSYGGWPNSGEIDIMEHVNKEGFIHQTIHNAQVTDANGGSVATHRTIYKATDFNTYGIVWSPESIQFYVNDVLQYTYAKAANATSKQWPFDKPFYLILNQAGGAGWPGAINNADLPFSMQVDWVRVYKQG
jgi:beta-glucanase (GH16 family)